MAAYARDCLGVATDGICLEDRSRTTRENLAFALPLVAAADVIKVVSDPLHAARGRSYVRELRPDLADRLGPADDYRFLERSWIKLACVVGSIRGVRAAVRPPDQYKDPREGDSATPLQDRL